jgi:hypothetical protein
VEVPGNNRRPSGRSSSSRVERLDPRTPTHRAPLAVRASCCTFCHSTDQQEGAGRDRVCCRSGGPPPPRPRRRSWCAGRTGAGSDPLPSTRPMPPADTPDRPAALVGHSAGLRAAVTVTAGRQVRAGLRAVLTGNGHRRVAPGHSRMWRRPSGLQRWRSGSHTSPMGAIPLRSWFPSVLFPMSISTAAAAQAGRWPIRPLHAEFSARGTTWTSRPRTDGGATVELEMAVWTPGRTGAR